MRSVGRIADEEASIWGVDGSSYYFNDLHWGVGDGHAYGAWDIGDGGVDLGQDLNRFLLPMTNEYCRTERVFRCAGCVGGYECSIHGRRL